MLPAIVRGGTVAIKAIQNPFIQLLLKLGIVGVVAIGSYLLLKKQINKWRTKSETKNVGVSTREGIINQIAQMFRNGFFPLGEPKWGHIFPDGTVEETIYQAAAVMYKNRISFAEVSKAYNRLYPSQDLLTDFQRELSNSEQQKFYDILSGGSINGIRFNQKMLTTKPAVVYNHLMFPVGKLRPRLRIGNMQEARVDTRNGKTYYGFRRNGKTLFISENHVIAA